MPTSRITALPLRLDSMPIRRPRKITADPSANVIEKLRKDKLRDDRDKRMLAKSGVPQKLKIQPRDLRVGDRLFVHEDSEYDTVLSITNINSHYPMVELQNRAMAVFEHTDWLTVKRPYAKGGIANAGPFHINPDADDHSIYVDHSQGYPRPDPVNGFTQVARIHTIKVNDIVCHKEEYDKPLRVFNIADLADGRIHLMCTPLDVQSHGYGPIHIYGPTGMYVRKRKV
jgi:hypothetical protein